MTHHWRVDGSQGHYVHHTTADSGRGTDSIGVGLNEDVLGPFSSARLAQVVANALNNAYALGSSDRLDAVRRERSAAAEGRFTRGPEPPASTDR